MCRRRELNVREEASARSARGERTWRRARWSEDKARAASAEDASWAGGKRCKRDEHTGKESSGPQVRKLKVAVRARMVLASQRAHAWQAGVGAGVI